MASHIPNHSPEELSLEKLHDTYRDQFLDHAVESYSGSFEKPNRTIDSPLREAVAMTRYNIGKLDNMTLHHEANRATVIEPIVRSQSHNLYQLVTDIFTATPEIADPKIISEWLAMQDLESVKELLETNRQQLAAALKNSMNLQMVAQSEKTEAAAE